MKSTNSQSTAIGQRSALFSFSESMFRWGLALVTFEQVRPFFSLQVSDYCFFLSLLLFLSRPRSRYLESRGSGVLLAAFLILSGALLSLRNSSGSGDAMGPLSRLFVLFGLFAPLAVVHSKQVRKNILYLVGGIFANCSITLLQAFGFPGIVKALSINPGAPDLSYIGRLQGLTSHPNALGLSATLAVLLGTGLLTVGENRAIRGRLVLVIVVCTLAALLSGSRTFLIALVPALIVLVSFQELHRQAMVRTGVVLIVLWGGTSYLAPGLLTQYSERVGLSGADYSSDSARLITAALTAEEISQKPLLGWGVDYFGEAAGLLKVGTGEVLGAEVTFLRYWYAVGVLGATGFLVLFAIPVRRILKARKGICSAHATNMLPLALASFALLFIASNLHPFLYTQYLYMPMFVFAGFAAQPLGYARAGMPTSHLVLANGPPGQVQPLS